MSTIIVASDAPSVRAEVISVLEEPDVEFVELHDGHAAAEAVDEHEPDLLVVDLQMGSMGAVAVCMELHLEESYGNLPHVPVLMLLDRRADVFVARRSAAEGWLVKPLDPIRLRRATSALLAGGIYHDQSYQPVPTSVMSSEPAPEPLPPQSQPPEIAGAISSGAAGAEQPAGGG